MSFGFDKSSSSSQETSRTFVDPNQQAALDFSRQLGQQLATGQLPGLQDQFGVAQGLVGQGQALLGGLGDIGGSLQTFQPGGFGVGGAGVDALTGIAQGTNPALAALTRQAQGENPFVSQQINQLGEDIARQVARQTGGAGGVGTQANLAGQLGGSRQGIAEGLVGEEGIRQFARGATGIRSEDIGRQLSAAAQAAGLQGQAGGQLAGLGLQQGLQGGAQRLQGLLGAGEINLGALAGLGGIQNLGFEPFAQQLNPALALASIVGPATVLSEAQGTSKSSSFGISAGGIPI